jgi:hypothetical protein
VVDERIYTWEEFKEAATSLRSNESRSAAILFRGQQSSIWKLDTTLERSLHDEGVIDYYRLILRLKTEIEISTNRNWSDDPSITELQKLTGDYDTFSRAMSNFPHYAYLAYLRHHGFPSPLLDWSRSPFVAAYFAFREDRPYQSSVAIYAYDERPQSIKTGSSDSAQIHRFGPYVAAHKRHFAQQSQYTVCVQQREGKWDFVPHSNVFETQSSDRTQDILHKFTLDISEREKVLTELNDYNLNAYSLFASEESLMETLSIREELF